MLLLAVTGIAMTGCGSDEHAHEPPYMAPNIVWVSIYNNTAEERLCSLSTVWSDGERELQFTLADEAKIAAGSSRRGDPRVGDGGALTVVAQCSLENHAALGFTKQTFQDVPDRCDIRADYSVTDADAQMRLTLSNCDR